MRVDVSIDVTDLPGKSFYALAMYQVIPSCVDNSGYRRPYEYTGGVLDYETVRVWSKDPALFRTADELDQPVNSSDFSNNPFNRPIFSDRLSENGTREKILFRTAHHNHN